MAGVVHLTFDDGPDEVWTARVLEELERAGARATFFVIGGRVAAHPDLLERVRSAGHQVEPHCMRHVVHSRCWRAQAEDDIDECLRELAQLGVEPRHWRPPGGGLSPWSSDVAAARGLRLAGWSADTCDWRDDSAAAMLELVAPAIEDDAVVLMHDSVGPGARREACSGTVELIAPLVDLIRDRGLEPAVLGEGSPLQDQGFTVFSPRGTDRPAHHADPTSTAARVETVAERELSGEDRARIVQLISAGFGPVGEEYSDRGWRTIEPVTRILVRAGDAIAAHAAVVPLEVEPPVPAFGLADAVVLPAQRGRGLGGRITAAAVEECWHLGAEMILTDSVDLARALVSHGFEPVPRFAFYYERDGACHCHRHWLAASRGDPPGTRLRLVQGDF